MLEDLYRIAISTSYGLCQSCKTNKIDWEFAILEEEGIMHTPFCLCNECRNRFVHRALRPLEYYNLVATLGRESCYHLHDDFYDPDTGEAYQAEIDVIDADKYPFPKLRAVENDLNSLIDYACVVNRDQTKAILLLKAFDKESAFTSIKNKLNQRFMLNPTDLYEIVGKVLGTYATDWVRDEWQKRSDRGIFVNPVLLVDCLPKDEAFDLLIKEIDPLENPVNSIEMYALGKLQTTRTLDWIENHADKITNVSASWGTIAASSCFTWERASRWLLMGRPLSLIALDALVEVAKPQGKFNSKKTLLDTSLDLEQIKNTLSDYLEKDKVARTKRAVAFILENLNGL